MLNRRRPIPEHVAEFLEAAEAGTVTPTVNAPRKRRRVSVEQLYAEARAAERQAAAWFQHGLPRPGDPGII